MSLKDYENVIIKAHDMGALWPERCVRREDIASVEAKLGVKFSEQMLDFYTNCGDMTISDKDVRWLDPKDMEDRDRLINAYAVEIHFKSGLTRSNLMISLVPEDLSRFAEYLRTKVPEVHRS